MRPGSGMGLRRLGVLVRGLPPDAQVWAEVRAAYERSLKPSVAQIRARQAHYDSKKAAKGGEG